jgi:hypothetical protein
MRIAIPKRQHSRRRSNDGPVAEVWESQAVRFYVDVSPNCRQHFGSPFSLFTLRNYIRPCAFGDQEQGMSKDISGSAMTMRDEYLTRAAEFFARARCDNSQRVEFENLAKYYLRLAMEADRNSHRDGIYEQPTRKLGDKTS